MTYLVMECHPSYAIVLDNEGRMIKAANMGYQEGQVVGEIIARQTPKAPILFRLSLIHILEFILAGATAVAIGTANFHNPYATVETVDGIRAYMETYGIGDIRDLIGAVR